MIKAAAPCVVLLFAHDLQTLASLSGAVPMVCVVMGASAGHGALTAGQHDELGALRVVVAHAVDVLRGRAAGDEAAISDSAKRGLKLFIGKAACSECHSGPTFSDEKFHVTGVPQIGEHVPEADDGPGGVVVAPREGCPGGHGRCG